MRKARFYNVVTLACLANTGVMYSADEGQGVGGISIGGEDEGDLSCLDEVSLLVISGDREEYGYFVNVEVGCFCLVW